MRRRELERDIREYNGDDPLEPWLRSAPWCTCNMEVEQLRGCMHDHVIDIVTRTRAFSSRLVTSLHRLVKWTQEHLGGGSKAQLQETIEKCTHALASLGSKYYPDVRYLRLWIQYVSRPMALRGMWRESCHCGGQRQGSLLIKHIFTCTLQADCLSDPSDVFFYLRVSINVVNHQKHF